MGRAALWQRLEISESGTRRLRIAAEMSALLLVAVLLGYLMQRLHHANLSVLFLLVVLIIAARHGLWPSIATSALGFLAFNFFFTAPYGTFRVTEEGDIATLLFFLAIAILGGNLASRLRAAIRRRDQALERISNLYDFSHRIAGAATAREITRTLVNHLSETLGAEVVVREGGKRGTPPVTLSVPVGMAAGREMHIEIRNMELSDEQRSLVRNLCGQARVALDRIRLAEDLESSRREAERARLRSALLTSVSHDLRTPLASIIGAASSVQDLWDTITPDNRAELLNTVMDEARRLNGYIQNLLDMTRIEHGELKIQREWEEPSDLVNAAIRRARESWPSAPIGMHIESDTGLVNVHGELFVQALHNVLDNAVRYSQQGTPVEVTWRKSGGESRVEITDAGPGLDAAQREQMFDMFYRAESGDSQSGGTGLGLAITRGILEAHGGSAFAEPAPNGKGARIVLLLPDFPPAESGDGVRP